MILKWLRGLIRYQFSDMSNVVPEQKFSPREAIFFMNSEAGLLKYRIRWKMDRNKYERDITTFRDIYINKFDTISKMPKGKKRTKALFEFYNSVRGMKNMSYKANIDTRIKAFWHWLGV